MPAPLSRPSFFQNYPDPLAFEDKGTGYFVDFHDPRDNVFSMVAVPAALPSFMDPIDLAFPVYDQGTLNACVGFAYKAASQVAIKNLLGKEVEVSAGFVWRAARAARGWQNLNTGCLIRDAVKAGNSFGVPSEALYQTGADTVAAEPSAEAKAQAADHPVFGYAAIPDAQAAKGMLVTRACVIFGTILTAAFSRARDNGGLFLPPAGPVNGAHAMTLVGYDDSIQVPGWTQPGAFRYRNSWSARWGDKGYGWLPYQHFNSEAVQDAWALTDIRA